VFLNIKENFIIFDWWPKKPMGTLAENVAWMLVARGSKFSVYLSKFWNSIKKASRVPEGTRRNLPVVNDTFTEMTVFNAPPLSLAFEPSRRFDAHAATLSTEMISARRKKPVGRGVQR